MRRLEPYAWLGAGAVTLGLGAALVSGAGVASAEDGSGGTQSSSGDSTSSASGPSGSSGSGDTTSKRTTTTSTTDDDDAADPDSSGTVTTEPDEAPDDPETGLDEADDDTKDSDDAIEDSDDATGDKTDDDGAESKTETDSSAAIGQSDESAGADALAVVDTDMPPTAELDGPAGDSAPEESPTFTYRTVDAPSASSLAAAPIAAEAAQLVSVPIGGDIFAAVAKDFQDRLNPLFSAALGVYHLQTAVVELRTFHLPSAFLNALNAAFALTTTGLYLIPWGGWLSPIPAALGTGTAYLNYVGKSFIPLW